MEVTKEDVEGLLDEVLLDITTPGTPESHLHSDLANLGGLLQQTIHSEHLRDELAHSERTWRLIRATLDCTVDLDTFVDLKMRLLRGVVILGRNLLSMDREHAETLHIREATFGFLTRLESIEVDHEIEKNTFVSSFELLANLLVNKKKHDIPALHELAALIEKKEHVKDQRTEEMLHPVLVYIDSLFNDTDVLYDSLSKGNGVPILMMLLEQYEKLNVKEDLSQYGLLVIRIFTKLILHESFLKFISTYVPEETMVRFLRVSQAIITSREGWEVFDLTVVLSWNFELFQKTVVEVQEYFKNKNKDVRIVYGKVSSVMDVLSTLSHLDHAIKFLLSYNGVELLVSLLGAIHTNVKQKSKLKDNTDPTSSQEIDYKSFPHIKSMIIETLTSLVHENFEVQEKIRELHGLPLILSNCVIDDNEPFIKERAIVCVRFLLKDNVKNQEFVAKLEAKEVIPDEMLDEVGFEVEIKDGKVQMKQKPKIEELSKK